MRKTICLLITVIISMVTLCVYGEELTMYESTGMSHNVVTDAYILDQSDFAKAYRFKTSTNNALSPQNYPVFFSIVLPQDGTLYIGMRYFLEPGTADAAQGRFEVYDRNNTLIYNHNLNQYDLLHHTDPGELVVYTKEVRQGEKLSFAFVCTAGGSLGQGSVFEGEFSLCFNNTHVEDDYSEISKEPTCTEPGEETWPCVLCNSAARTRVIPALGHEKSDELTVIKQATCIESGLEGHLCTRCGEIVDMNEIKALGHSEGVAHTIKEASCISEGLIEYRCDRCNEVLSTETLSKTDHTPGVFENYKAATCTTDGVQAQYCQVCKALLNTNPIPALGHNPGKWIVVKEATETSTGLKEQRCTVCNEVLKTETIPASNINP